MKNEHILFGRTEVEINPNPEKILRNHRSIWMGSCFVDSFSNFLQVYDYKAIVNPLGTVFHPLVLGELLFLPLEELLKKNFKRQGVWLNYWLGSGFSAETESGLIEQITRAKNETNVAFFQADWLVMTWGTAFWYEHEGLGMVGKCHRQPGTLFKKYRSDPNEIVGKWKNWIITWRAKNPKGKVLLTLSPVRHTRDGLTENSVSKAVLRIAIEMLRQSLSDVYYFPSYELVMDELRDYKYFEQDMVHPRKEVIGWIWNKFSISFLEDSESETNLKINALYNLKNHKVLNQFGDEFERWKIKIEEKEKEVLELMAIERGKLKV